MNTFEIIGLMSGTSLDGLDIAHVEFVFDSNNQDSFKLLNYSTFDIPQELKQKLIDAPDYSVQSILMLNKELAILFANCVNEFIESKKINKKSIRAIASHGQTILHQPKNGFTLQIGCGSTLSYLTKIDVINDFRTR
ncbi:MAG: hypothetical protein RI883_2588, partial [Bacteroidota bacterium]